LLRFSCQTLCDSSPDSFAAQVGSSFSHIRVRVGAAVAKAAVARFMPDSADNGLPVPVFWDKPTASKPSLTYDHPLHHKPCHSVSVSLASDRVSVYAHDLYLFLFCLCFGSPMLSRVFSTPLTVRFCSFYTQLRLILFIYWSSPLLFNKVLITPRLEPATTVSIWTHSSTFHH